MIRIPIEALQTAMFASTNITRENLTYLALHQRSNEEIQAVATNGHVAMLVRFEGRLDGKTNLFLKAQAVLEALKSAPKKVREVGAELEGGMVRFANGAVYPVETHEDFLPGGKVYPDVEAVVPPFDPPEEAIEHGTEAVVRHDPVAVDLAYVTDLAAWAKACGRSLTVRMLPRGLFDPIRFDSFGEDGPKMTFILMPCRLD